MSNQKYSEFQKKPCKNQKFVAEASFKFGVGSLFKCLSLGIFDLLIRFMNFDNTVMILKNRLSRDLNSLEKNAKILKVDLKLLKIYKNLFDYFCKVPDKKLGFSWLYNNCKQDKVCESFDKIMRSLLNHISPKGILSYYMNFCDKTLILPEILKALGDHFCICIHLIKKSHIKVIIPDYIECCPILYINQSSGNFKILYTQEALEIESGLSSQNLMKSINILHREKSNLYLKFRENIPSLQKYRKEEEVKQSGVPNNNIPQQESIDENKIISKDENNVPSSINLENISYSNNEIEQFLKKNPVICYCNPPSVEKVKRIFAYTHYNFYIEVILALWNNHKIITKKYSKLDNKIWNPEQFYNEIKILQSCSEFSSQNYPFLKCFAVYLIEESILIFLEYFGMNLENKLLELKEKKIQFEENELKKIVYRLLNGFSMLEGIGITHRDIKPSNILISGSGENIDVKIIDFSISGYKLFGIPTTHEDEVRTTYNYRAPEIVDEDKVIYNAFKSDVYSLGLVFLQLSDVNLNIIRKNKKDYQPLLIEDIKQVKYDWLKDLLNKMLGPVAERPYFRESIDFFEKTLLNKTEKEQ